MIRLLHPQDPETEGLPPKAARLARAWRGGFPVPPFVVLECSAADPGDPDLTRAVERARTTLPAVAVWAVRSAGGLEDAAGATRAGRYLTRLDVPSARLLEAVREVLRDARAKDGDRAGWAVILQSFIEPDWAGVTFTRDPRGSREAVAEFVRGRGATVVGGAVAPRREVWTWSTAVSRRARRARFLRLGMEHWEKAETLFEGPQDIEWAIRGGRFHFLQSRPIGGLAPNAWAMYRRLDADLPRGPFLWEKTEATEPAPRPSPFAFSLLRRIYASDGPVAAVYRRWGLRYEDTGFLVRQGVDLYVDREKELRALFPAMTRLRPGDRPGWRGPFGLFRTIWNGAAWSAHRPRARAEEADALLERIAAVPAAGTLSHRLGGFLKDYERIFDINARAARALADLAVLARRRGRTAAEAIDRGARLLTEGERRRLQPSPPAGLVGNGLDVADESPFQSVAPRPMNSVGAVFPAADDDALRTAAILDRLRELGRWLAVRWMVCLREGLAELARARGQDNPKLLAFASIEEAREGGVAEVLLVERRDRFRADEAFRFPARLSDRPAPAAAALGVSAGRAEGPAVRWTGDPAAVPPGAVVYCPALTLDVAAALARAGALVAARGGLLSHVAVLAREAGVPAVVDPSAAFPARAGARVRVDGASGAVVAAEEVGRPATQK